jgi:hypothetical protein
MKRVTHWFIRIDLPAGVIAKIFGRTKIAPAAT